MNGHLPGFLLRNSAAAAGRKFFSHTNGRPGVEDRYFHVVQNSAGRWEFMPGRPPAQRTPPTGGQADV